MSERIQLKILACFALKILGACYERQASGETTNLAASLGEPEGTVWPGRDEGGIALGCWQRELADRARRRDAPDLVKFGEPEVAIRSGRDVVRRIVGWQLELADRACRRDAPDLAAFPFGVRNAHHFGK